MDPRDSIYYQLTKRAKQTLLPNDISAAQNHADSQYPVVLGLIERVINATKSYNCWKDGIITNKPVREVIAEFKAAHEALETHMRSVEGIKDV